MKQRMAEISQRQAAMVAAISLLLMAIAVGIADDLVFAKLFVPGDADATAANIMKYLPFFRVGVYSWLVVLVCDLLAAWGLYIFLRPVNRDLSLLTAWFRVVYVAILGAAIMNFVDVIILAGGDVSTAAFGKNRLAASVTMHLYSFNDIWTVGLIVFGFHVLLLGYLVYMSGYIPKVFGVLMMIAFVGYLVAPPAVFPRTTESGSILQSLFVIPMVAGELGLAVWLLFRGGRTYNTGTKKAPIEINKESQI